MLFSFVPYARLYIFFSKKINYNFVYHCVIGCKYNILFEKNIKKIYSYYQHNIYIHDIIGDSQYLIIFIFIDFNKLSI